MDELDVRALVTQLYIHVAALPWKDIGFERSAAIQGAAQDQIVDTTVREIMKLNKEQNDKETTNRETASQ